MAFPSTAMSADILWLVCLSVTSSCHEYKCSSPEEILASGSLPTFSSPSDFHKSSCVLPGEKLQH